MCGLTKAIMSVSVKRVHDKAETSRSYPWSERAVVGCAGERTANVVPNSDVVIVVYI